MERNTPEARTELERGWYSADTRVIANPNWRDFRNTARDYLHHLKRFVIWDAKDGQPQLVDLIRAEHIGISWSGGLEAIFKSARYETEFTVTNLPQEHIEGIFMWIPHFADVRFTPFQFSDPKSPKRLTLPICFRTHHSNARENSRHITEFKAFNQMSPGIF